MVVTVMLVISAVAMAENIDPMNDDSRYAWGENVGWINFAPIYGEVTIDEYGWIEGWAWGENIGWIHLSYSVDVTIDKTGVDEMTLTFNSRDGVTYNIYTCTDLSLWGAPADTVTGDPVSTDWIDASATGSRKFYLVEDVNPPGNRVRTSW